MRVVVITPPDPVVSLDAAKAHLKVQHGADDALIEGLVAAATQHIDGPAGWLGRAIGVQTLEARLDPSDAFAGIQLPYPPAANIISVTYLDLQRQEIVADPASYELVGDQVTAIGTAAWQGGLAGAEALRVRFVAGYATVPAPIRAAILLMVGDLYAFRESATAASTPAASAVPISVTTQMLLQPYRVYR